MKICLADHLLRNLSELGQAFDIGRQPVVYDGGRVGFPEPETEVEFKYELEGKRGPQPDHGKGPPDGKGRPVRDHGSGAQRLKRFTWRD